MTSIESVKAFNLLALKNSELPESVLLEIAEREANMALEPEDYLEQFEKTCPANAPIGDNIGLSPDKCNTRELKATSVCEKIVEISRQSIQGGWGKTNLTCHNERLYIFRHTHYQELPKKFISRLIRKSGWKLQVSVADQMNVKFAQSCEEQILHSSSPAKLPPKDAVFINVQNGVLKIGPNGPELRNHDPEHFFTYCLNYCYNKEAKAPRFQQLLDEVLPEKEAQMCLLEYIASCFFQNNVLKLEKAAFLIGEGENGKSVIYDIFKSLVGGQNVSGLTLSDMTKTKFMMPLLEGKLLNWSSDIGKTFEADLFKRLVSQETVMAEIKNGAIFELQRIPRLIFNGNEMVTSNDKTRGLWRRFLIFPFKVHIPKERQDPQLAAKIIDHECPGILNMLIHALHRLLNQKSYTESAFMEEALQQWKEEHNSALTFVQSSGLAAHKHYTIPFRDVCNRYEEWCYDNGDKAMDAKAFNKELKKLFKCKKSGTYQWFAEFPD